MIPHAKCSAINNQEQLIDSYALPRAEHLGLLADCFGESTKLLSVFIREEGEKKGDISVPKT